MKILISAYACIKDPDERLDSGGESELGWNLVLQAAKSNQVWVLTDAGNKAAIESKLSGKNIHNLYFEYVALPSWLQFLKKYFGGVQYYAYLWQIKAYFVAKKLHQRVTFDLFHHVTYANDWMASFIGALLPITYIRGPGGGAHKVPKAFAQQFSLRDRIGQHLRSIGQWVFRHDPFFVMSQNKAEVILVCNNESLSALKPLWQKRAQLFPVNGISLDDFKNLPEQLKIQDEFVILSAGKLLSIKGFDILIEAFKKVRKKIPSVRLEIAGMGPDFDHLKELAASVGSEARFLGWMPHKDLLAKIHTADVFVFPSLRDGGGAVVVEAMAAGKPVVCFDIAGPGFHIDQTCGIKIEPTNPQQAIDDMAEAIERLYGDKSLRVKLGRGARIKAEQQYSWDFLGDRLEKIYAASKR